jgi:lipopolysaccharide transport system ATP-binding protein
MSIPIISVKNIGKKYKLGATLGGRNYKTLRDVLTQAAFGPFRKLSGAFRKEPFAGGSHSPPNNPITQLLNNSITKSPNNPKEFWALKDISFDVQQGEVVGIIGANGAGKSTLLKILCGITEPTEGEIHIRGRIASLLEVGTGFHPELSGRENIYMNGAILGMTKSEIQAKFDEIVAFAEVEKFIDTPVKRYSSGMYVRLAFAVAAHLEPEILLVDEVLAVGDVKFQEKCLERMSSVTEEGKTVLFVSHNMAAIQNLTKWSILLDQGSVAFIGPTEDAIQKYLSNFRQSSSTPLSKRKDRTGLEPGALQNIRLFTSGMPVEGVAIAGMPLEIEVHYFIKRAGKPHFFLAFYDALERRVIHLNSIMSKMNGSLSSNEGTVRCVIPKLPLVPGRYSITAAIDCGGETLDRVEHTCYVMVSMGDFYGTGQITGSDWGMCLVENYWEAL